VEETCKARTRGEQGEERASKAGVRGERGFEVAAKVMNVNERRAK
jgi:hypothetical protein